MSVLLAQKAIFSKSGLPEDVFVNTFHFGTDGTDDAAAAALIAPVLHDMFNVAHDGVNALNGFWAKQVSTTAGTIKIYRLNDAKPRVPLLEAESFPQAVGATSLPSEVSVCGSYQATAESGQVAARRRGRFYFGPMATLGVSLDGDDSPRPTAALISALLASMEFLKAESDAAAEWSWIVYSTVYGLNDTRAVTNGWVDNALDTQRRRGVSPTSRTTWP